MNEQEIAMLRDELVCDAWISLLGFPEVEPASMQRDQANGRVMHAVQVTVLAGGGSVAGDEESPEHGSPRLLRIPSGLPPDSPTSEPISSRLAAGDTAAPSTRSKRSGTHARPNNQSRHQQFVQFLVDTFGLEALRAGAGVLDVAGGAGGVAFECAFRRGISCTTVDPRPMKASTKQRRAFRNRANAMAHGVESEAQCVMVASGGDGAGGWGFEDAREGEGGNGEGGEPSLPLVCAPCAGDGDEPELGSGESGAPGNAAAAYAPIAPSFLQAAAEDGVSAACLPRQLCAPFETDFAERHAPLWNACSVVVGMHPDQATEAMVDLALAHGKPFAIVPCCVFPKLFAARRLSDGGSVSTYSELVEYLLQKDASLERTELQLLEGRNTVVDSRGPMPAMARSS